MKLNHKLHAVVRHEFLTIIRQPSFWISLIAVPAIIGVVVLIGALTDSSDDKDIDPAKSKLQVALIDKSGVIHPEVVTAYKLTAESAADQSKLEARVKAGEIDGLIVYPSNLADKGKYQMFADNTDKNNGAIVSEIGRVVMQQSLLAPIDPQLAQLAISGGEGSVETYSNGKPERKIYEYIVPGAFLVLFYIVLVFSVGYALTSVSEEKENRSIEMVLSYVKPRTLILGKLFAIIMVTLTQIAFIALMAAIAYGIARSLGNDLSLPFKISDLTFVPTEILIGIGFLVIGFTFYIGLMAMVGAIFPSTKEASGFSTVFFILPAVPFWGMEAITDKPSSMFTQILTYFPLTSPTTTLVRNAAGNLELWQGLLSLTILFISTLGIIALAAKAFRLGTLEYSNRIKLSALLKK